MNIGIIGIKDAWSTEALSRHLKQKSAGGTVLELNELGFDLTTNSPYHLTHDLNEFDGFILKKLNKPYSSQLLDKLELLCFMENQGTRFFSSPTNIKKMISRLGCTYHLHANNIPMPPTFITADIDQAVEWAALESPVILKPLYSTKAQGMALLNTRDQAQEEITNLVRRGESTIYLQKKYDLEGSDYAVAFLGGKYIGAYSRVSDGSTWHTTTDDGGKYEAYVPSTEIIHLAERAQTPFNLDFCCVDIANTQEVGPIVFEVSAFGGYKGLQEAADIDVADLVTDYAISHITE